MFSCMGRDPYTAFLSVKGSARSEYLGQRKRLGVSEVEWATKFCTAILSAEEDELCAYLTYQAGKVVYM